MSQLDPTTTRLSKEVKQIVSWERKKDGVGSEDREGPNTVFKLIQ